MPIMVNYAFESSIYIKRCVSESVSLSPFVCPRGQTICLSPGTNISYTQERGRGQTCLTHKREGDKHFSHTGGD